MLPWALRWGQAAPWLLLSNAAVGASAVDAVLQQCARALSMSRVTSTSLLPSSRKGSMATRGVAWRGLAWRGGVAWRRGVAAWRRGGVAWRRGGVAWRRGGLSTP